MEALRWSEIAENVATTVAIVVGGPWAYWVWRHSEWAGALKHRAALDGSIVAEYTPLASGLLVVAVKAHWNNRSRFPVEIDTHKSIVTAYELGPNLQVGALPDARGLGKQIGEARVSLAEEFELEPKTNSELRVHFVVEPDKRYFFQWRMAGGGRKFSELGLNWERTLLWHATPNTALQGTRDEAARP